MDNFKEKKICIIGAGRVGTTLSVLIANMDFDDLKLKAISALHEESLEQTAKYIGDKSSKILFTTNNSKCAADCNCIFICTPDDIIEKVCSGIIDSGLTDFSGRLFVHFSGAKSLEVLKDASKAGAFVASMHPIKSFASIDHSVKTMKGTVFGITFQKDCPENIKDVIYYIVNRLGGRTVEVVYELKSLYHASACVASNYLVSLINYAVKIHKRIGIKPEESLKGLIGLIEGTVDNIKKLGTKKALTGPIARGDVGTIKEHIKNFKKCFKGGEDDVYRVMGKETSRIAYENGWIDRKTLEEFEKIFKLG